MAGNKQAQIQAETGFGQSLMELSHRWRRAVDAELRPLGLSQATWRTLVFVARTGDDLLQKDLANILGIEGPSLVPLLDTLESGGLIERQVSKTDRRAKTIHLTNAGEQTIANIRAVAEKVGKSILDGVSPQELDNCLAVFNAIRSNMEDLDTQRPEKKKNVA
ncbi:MAG: MarR family transcriptional regulator [Rhodospirillales bacterium]|nr:MarR family transcriptional regulator [Rhodospirillales bacterium]